MSRVPLTILTALTGCNGCQGSDALPPWAAPASADAVPITSPTDTELPVELDCGRTNSTSCMVHVPGGTFPMGAQSTDPEGAGYDPDALDNEGPVHTVTISEFWMLVNETTSSQYGRCVGAGWCSEDDIRQETGSNYGDHARRDHPMNLVTWTGAARFCAWLGGRLPTEAEWAYAARGPEARRFPWGSEVGCGTGIEDPTQPWTKIMEPPPCRHGGTSHPSDLRGDSPFGLKGMAGNVWEWTADWYAEDAYAKHAATDPTGPREGTLKVQRGGGWTDEDPTALRAAGRAAMPIDTALGDVGFRCVWTPPATSWF